MSMIKIDLKLIWNLFIWIKNGFKPLTSIEPNVSRIIARLNDEKIFFSFLFWSSLRIYFFGIDGIFVFYYRSGGAGDDDNDDDDRGNMLVVVAMLNFYCYLWAAAFLQMQ